jgi:hypothetical protein
MATDNASAQDPPSPQLPEIVPNLDAPLIQPLESVTLDECDEHSDRPIAMRRAIRTRRIPARFGKLSDLLPSAQMAALTIYSEAITPESSPTPSQVASPLPISRPPSPMSVDMPLTEPMIHETVANQFGLY